MFTRNQIICLYCFQLYDRNLSSVILRMLIPVSSLNLPVKLHSKPPVHDGTLWDQVFRFSIPNLEIIA